MRKGRIANEEQREPRDTGRACPAGTFWECSSNLENSGCRLLIENALGRNVVVEVVYNDLIESVNQHFPGSRAHVAIRIEST